MRPSRIALLTVASLIAWQPAPAQVSPAGLVEGEPQTVQSFEQPAGGTNPAGFRFTYPVRDTDTSQVYTEERPPSPTSLPGTSAAATTAATAGPTGTTTPAKPVPRKTRAPQPRVIEEEIATPTNVQLESIDIGEGRFERSPFRFSFGISEGYNSNVNTASVDPVESVYTAINANVTYVFGGPRLSLSTGISANLTYYYSAPIADNWLPNATWDFAGNYKASERMELSFTTMTSFLSQGASNLYGAPTSNVGEYFYSDSVFGLEYKWAPKFATISSYSPLFVIYADQLQQDLVGRVEQTFGQQFVYLWRPTTDLVAEYRFNSRNYFINTSLNSWGNIFLAGFDHTLNPSSEIVFRGGVEQRVNENPFGGGQNNYLGPFGQLDFNYALGKSTDISLYSRYSTAASGLGDINQGQQLLLGFSVQRDITARISARAYLNYQNNYYDQPDANFGSFSDNVYSAGVTIGYALNRNWSFNAGYQYNGIVSGNQNQQGDYNQNIAFIGAQFGFGGPKQ
jgi:hypothetical protein